MDHQAAPNGCVFHLNPQDGEKHKLQVQMDRPLEGAGYQICLIVSRSTFNTKVVVGETPSNVNLGLFGLGKRHVWCVCCPFLRLGDL